VLASSPGTSGDARTRLIAEKLSTRLGRRFIVENKPGASTTIATALVAAAKPDGYVLLSTFTPAFTVGPLLYKSARYDPASSFAPIAMFAQGSPFLVVHPKLPAATMKEFVTLAKARPGSISLAYAGPGAANHLPAELFRQAAGIEFLYVPYKARRRAIPDVRAGQVSAMFAYTTTAVPLVKGGKLHALAVAQSKRNEALPDVPTFAEAGYPGCEFRGTMLLLAPAGGPGDLWSTGAEPVYGSSEEVRPLIRREAQIAAALVKRLGIEPERAAATVPLDAPFTGAASAGTEAATPATARRR
jgi:tripartite-type tricarboxylate transporter receptor subunit TctC